MTDLRDTCLVIRGEKLSAPNARTYIVSGLARGGTSMVAAMLRAFGVHMGEYLGESHEDLDFYTALNENFPSPDWDRIDALVAERNSHFNVWGFKSPLLIANGALAQLLLRVRNPVVVLAVRDLLGTVRSRVNRDQEASELSISEYANYFRVLASLVHESSAPMIVVQYEKACQLRWKFINEFVDVLGISCNQRSLAEAVSLITGEGGGYKNFDAYYYGVDAIDGRSSDLRNFVEAQTDVVPGSLVRATQENIAFGGDIFDGPETLLKILITENKAFPINFIVEIMRRGVAVNDFDEYQNGINLYGSFDSKFSLGISANLAVIPTGRLYRVETKRPLRALALGLAHGGEKGRVRSAIRVRIYQPTSRESECVAEPALDLPVERGT
jgi:hypothetical protein